MPRKRKLKKKEDEEKALFQKIHSKINTICHKCTVAECKATNNQVADRLI